MYVSSFSNNTADLHRHAHEHYLTVTWPDVAFIHYHRHHEVSTLIRKIRTFLSFSPSDLMSFPTTPDWNHVTCRRHRSGPIFSEWRYFPATCWLMARGSPWLPGLSCFRRGPSSPSACLIAAYRRWETVARYVQRPSLGIAISHIREASVWFLSVVSLKQTGYHSVYEYAP